MRRLLVDPAAADGVVMIHRRVYGAMEVRPAWVCYARDAFQDWLMGSLASASEDSPDKATETAGRRCRHARHHESPLGASRLPLMLSESNLGHGFVREGDKWLPLSVVIFGTKSISPTRSVLDELNPAVLQA